MKYQGSSTHCSKTISKVKCFKKGQTPRSRSQCQTQLYPLKDFIKGNMHVKYQSSSIHCSKVISKVKVFKNDQTPRSRSKGKQKCNQLKALFTGNIP